MIFSEMSVLDVSVPTMAAMPFICAMLCASVLTRYVLSPGGHTTAPPTAAAAEAAVLATAAVLDGESDIEQTNGGEVVRMSKQRESDAMQTVRPNRRRTIINSVQTSGRSEWSRQAGKVDFFGRIC